MYLSAFLADRSWWNVRSVRSVDRRAQNIFFAQLADPSVGHFAVSATRFMSGKFPLMIFGLPGAALAMYKTARPEKQKAAAGLLLSAALTSMLTGITEPLEFTFLFVAPVLYVIHCIFAGLAYMFMHICNVGVGMTFQAGSLTCSYLAFYREIKRQAGYGSLLSD